jgi:hypothetical protein
VSRHAAKVAKKVQNYYFWNAVVVVSANVVKAAELYVFPLYVQGYIKQFRLPQFNSKSETNLSNST